MLLLLLLCLGLADGVGGWRRYGIDPGEFSAFLMRTCQRLVETGRFEPNEPARLLGNSYYELLQSKRAILGTLSTYTGSSFSFFLSLF